MSVHKVVETQREYFRSGETLSVSFRKEQLYILKRLIENEHDSFEEAVKADLRRATKTTYSYEVQGLLGEIDYMINNIDAWTAPHKVEKTLLTILDTPMTVKDPLGVVLVISPWNYPVVLAIQPLIAALAAGNTVVIKPSDISAHTSEIFAKVFPKYFDPRYIAVVTGGVTETTELLKERFDYIFYTGSPGVGKVVLEAASKHLTPVTLELGGKSPVVVDDEVDVDIAGKRIAWGKWMNCGQTCVAPDYILTTDAMKAPLVQAIQRAVNEFYGNDIQTSSDYARIINHNHFDRLSTLLDKSNAAVLYKAGELDREDTFIPPIILDAAKDDASMQQEIFGPILPIVTVSSFDEAVDFINAGEKPLAAYLFSRNEKKIHRFCERTFSGGVTINDVILHITVDTLPFGGVGGSGMGQYHGKYGFDTFSHEKGVLKRGFFGESLMSMRYPPMTKDKFEQSKSVMGTRRAMPKLFNTLIPIIPTLLIGILIGIVIQRFGLQ